MKYLALWAESPLQSWGVDSRFGLRLTFRFPTKSGIAGIILSSLGRGGEEKDFLKDFSKLKETAISFCRKGKEHSYSELIDYQIVGAAYNPKDTWEEDMILRHRNGTPAQDKKNSIPLLTYRHYLQDAFFGIVQEVDDDMAAPVVDGLMNPVWPLYLGRKCCVPTHPIFNGVFDTESEALDKILEIAEEKGLVERERLVEGKDKNAYDVFYLQDVPMCFGMRKKYTDRVVSILKTQNNE